MAGTEWFYTKNNCPLSEPQLCATRCPGATLYNLRLCFLSVCPESYALSTAPGCWTNISYLDSPRHTAFPVLHTQARVHGSQVRSHTHISFESKRPGPGGCRHQPSRTSFLPPFLGRASVFSITPKALLLQLKAAPIGKVGGSCCELASTEPLGTINKNLPGSVTHFPVPTPGTGGLLEGNGIL